jgi:hypothetical protein
MERRRGCGFVLLVLVLLAICAGVVIAAALFLAGEPNEIRTSATTSADVIPLGEQFTVTVNVENVDLEAVRITAIGLSRDILDGASVAATDPPVATVQERDLYVLGAWQQYPINQLLLGGTSTEFTFTLTAARPGAYSGDVTVWVENDILGVAFERARRERVEFEVH